MKKIISICLVNIYLVSTLFCGIAPTINNNNCLPQATAQDYINSKLSNAIAYLNDHGVSNSEIIQEFGSLQHPGIVTTYSIANYIESNNDQFNWDVNGHIVNGGGSSSEPNAYECALDAFGVLGIAELFKGRLTAAAASALVKKVASRTLGVIGAAWAVWDFANCMGWVGIISQEDLDLQTEILTNNYTPCAE